jgi:hypothetical protein
MNKPSVAKIYENGALAGESFGYIFHQRCQLTASIESALLTTGWRDSRPFEPFRVVKLWL